MYFINYANDSDIVFKSDDGSGGTQTYFFLDGSSGYTRFPDSKILGFGDGGDLTIQHDSNHSYINANGTGDLIIKQMTADKDISFQCDNGSGGETAYITLDGSATRIDISKYMRFADGVEARFGAQSDLQIHHDGSNSYITQNGTGDLYIKQMTADEDLVFQCDDGAGGDATYFYLDGSSAVHDGSATTSLYTNWPDSSRISLGTGHDLNLFHNGFNSTIQNLVGDLYIETRAADKDIIFRADDGSGSLATYFSLDGSLASGGFVYTKWPDNSAIALGSSNDLVLWHDASNSYIRQVGTGDLIIENITDDKDIIFKSDNGSGGTAAYITLDGSSGYVDINRTMYLDDNIDLRIGTAGDLELAHDGANSYITQQGTGNLIIQQTTDDADIIFKSDDGSGGVETYFFLDGSSGGGAPFTVFPDNSNLVFGDGHDLRIFHDSANSYVENKVGNLEIKNDADDGDIIFKSDNGSGGTTAYLTLDGTNVRTKFHKAVNLEDDVQLQIGNSQDLKLYHDGSHSYISQEGVGNLYIQTLTDDGDIIFISDNSSGGTMEYFRVDGSDHSVQFSRHIKFNTNGAQIFTRGIAARDSAGLDLADDSQTVGIAIADGAKVIMPNLPTSDPSNAGQLWNDSGTLKISAG